ncbi:unnamed protein product, partial [Dicrocoelium dendriticum]
MRCCLRNLAVISGMFFIYGKTTLLLTFGIDSVFVGLWFRHLRMKLRGYPLRSNESNRCFSSSRLASAVLQ